MTLLIINAEKITIGLVNSLSCDLNKGKNMHASVIYTHLHDNNFLLKVFLWDGMDLKFEIGHKGGKYSLRNTSRMQNIEFAG